MANEYIFEQKVANSFLLLLKNNLVMGKLVTTKFDQDFSKSTVSHGNTVKVRRPVEFTVREGRVASAQDLKVGYAEVAIDKQRGVDVEFNSDELTLSVDDLLKNQMLKSQAAALAQHVDADIAAQTLKFSHWVGTPGQTVDSVADFFVAPQRMDELAIPQDDRHAILSPADYWSIAGKLTALNSDSTVKTALEKARLPLIGNIQPYMTQNVRNLTVGTRVASGISQVDGASQNVAYPAVKDSLTQTLNVKGLTTGQTIKAGEVFTIADVYAVNPISKVNLGYLQMFTVRTDAEADVAGKAALTISAPIITSGAYQTVTAAPGNSAAITWLGTASTAYLQNAAFHRGAIGLVSVKLQEPESGKFAYQTDPDTGITVRIWRHSDVTNDLHITRLDILYGTVCLDPRLGVRFSGTL